MEIFSGDYQRRHSCLQGVKTYLMVVRDGSGHETHTPSSVLPNLDEFLRIKLWTRIFFGRGGPSFFFGAFQKMPVLSHEKVLHRHCLWCLWEISGMDVTHIAIWMSSVELSLFSCTDQPASIFLSAGFTSCNQDIKLFAHYETFLNNFFLARSPYLSLKLDKSLDYRALLA